MERNNSNVCKKTGISKGLSKKEYNKQYDKQWKINNPEKVKKYNKQYYINNPEKVKQYSIKHLYDISSEEYFGKLYLQNNYCAICGKHQDEFRRNLAVDHNHITEQIRGLLCYKCNTLLGNVSENVSILKEAIKYLDEWNGTPTEK